MGFFSKKNKPITEGEMDKMFGQDINKTQKRDLSRKENREIHQKRYDIEKQKQAILGKLNEAYRLPWLQYKTNCSV